MWKVKSSQLNLVDLAGSERQKDTNTFGQRLKVKKQSLLIAFLIADILTGILVSGYKFGCMKHLAITSIKIMDNHEQFLGK